MSEIKISEKGTYKKELNEFEEEVNKMNISIGIGPTRTTLKVFLKVIKWLRENGHGQIHLNAIEHRLSNKIKIEQIFDVNNF